MTRPSIVGTRRDQQFVVLLALAATYFVWGSTYLGIRFALEGFPPLTLNAGRFAVGGTLLYGLLRARGVEKPTPVQWRNGALSGALLMIGGVGLVTIAEDLGVGSGLAATAVAVMPLWAAMWSGLFGMWPVRLEWTGLVLGFAGVALLAQEGDFRSTLGGTALMILAPLLWSFGSVWSVRLDLAKGSMATATQMLAAAPLFLVLAVVFGESFDGAASVKAWLSLLYLAIFGSVLAYNAYLYLLRTVRSTLATSYAYANPVVALFLGVTLGDEVLTGPVWIALPLILAGLAIVGYAQSARARRRGDERRAAAATLMPRR